MNKALLNGLRSPGIIFLLFAIALIAYRTTVGDLFRLWLNSSNVTYTHGALLLCVCIFLFYRRWRVLAAELAIKPAILGLFFLFICSLVWFLAWAGNVAIIQQLLVVAVFCLILWSILGFESMKKLMFPILLIICAIPVWEVINEGWLQKITATAVAEIMELIGYSVYREGALIHLSAGTFKVAQNCSGMRQLVAAITIGFIYSYINDVKIYWVIVFLFALALLSFVVNTLRIFVVVLAGQLTEMEHYFVREDHVTLGWILFAIAIFIFIRVIDKHHSYFSRTKNSPVKSAPVKLSDRRIILAVGLTLLALLLGPTAALLYGDTRVGRCGEIIIPAKINGWEASTAEYLRYKPSFTPADKVVENIFTNQSGDNIYSYIGYFSSQNQDRELISSLNKIADGDEWIQVSKNKYQLTVNKEKMEVEESMIRSANGSERLVWHWYYMSGKKTTKAIAAKLYGIWDKLAHNSGATVFLISVEITDSRSAARRKLNLFAKQSELALKNAVDSVRCEE